MLGLFHVEVVSARLNPSHGTIDVTRVYVPRFFVSSQQRFGATDIKALGASQLSGLGQTVLQLYFIYKIAGESKTRREESGGVRGEGEGERERVRKHFGSSFYMFFPPPGPALCKLGLARSAVCSVCSA